MKRFSSIALNLGLILLIGLGLGGCVTTRLPYASYSPWQEVELNTEANPLDIAFVDEKHGFLIGTNRLILETNNAGKIYIIKGLQVEPINSITGAIPGAKIATVVCIVSNITFNNINRLKLYFFRFLFDDLDDVKSKTSKL